MASICIATGETGGSKGRQSNKTLKGFNKIHIMSTYTQLLYQIVFSTRNRSAILLEKNRIELFKYIHGILLNKKCRLYRINGGSDHLHIVTHIHPEVAIASLVKDIKLASSSYIRQKPPFPRFQWLAGWLFSIYLFNQCEGSFSSVCKEPGNASSDENFQGGMY